jgi:hypothetical protein
MHCQAMIAQTELAISRDLSDVKHSVPMFDALPPMLYSLRLNFSPLDASSPDSSGPGGSIPVWLQACPGPRQQSTALARIQILADSSRICPVSAATQARFPEARHRLVR